MTKKIAITLCLASTIILADELSDLLVQTTELATKTKLNIDYIPGIISVISGDEMKALGINNLAEPNAFDMIVGMDTQSLSLRGTGADYGAYGNTIKWMVNGKEFNSEVTTPTNWTIGRFALPIPIDMVDRVEVIRGPGSSLYGGNAVFGIVNIVTKKDFNAAFLGASSAGSGKFGENGGGAISFKGENYKVDASLGAQKSDGYNLNVQNGGNFYSWTTNTQQIGAGQLSNGNSSLSAMLDVNVYDYKAWVYQYNINSALGSYGLWIPNFPRPINSNPFTVQNSKTHTGLEKSYSIVDDLKLTPKLWYLQTSNSANNFYYLAPNQTASGQNGYTNRTYTEAKKTAQLDAEYKLYSHLINGGLFYQVTSNINDAKYSNAFSSSGSYNYGGTFWYAPKMSLYTRAAYLQDQWSIADSATITYGARYDAFSPQNLNKYQALSPRIAGVWAINSNNIIKAQYSKAFRPPTMTDLADNTSLQPETVDTFELGYIFKSGNHTIKPTVYESRIYNMIYYNGYTGATYNNKYCSKIDGVELEYKFTHEFFILNLNASAFNTYSPQTSFSGGNNVWNLPSQKFDLSPSYLGNIWVTLQPQSDYPTTIWAHFIGSQMQTNYPTSYSADAGATYIPVNLSNGNIGSQNYVNITQQFKGLYKYLDISIGVSDVFNTTMTALRMPLSYYNTSGGHNTQPVPYMGSTFWLNGVYKF